MLAVLAMRVLSEVIEIRYVFPDFAATDQFFFGMFFIPFCFCFVLFGYLLMSDTNRNRDLEVEVEAETSIEVEI